MPRDNRVRFSPSDSDETDAVITLRYIVDRSRVRIDSQERDKLPAMDGDIYLVEDDWILGKLVVQIKKLSEENHDSPKKQFDVPVLKYYQVEPAPILFIVVDTESNVAYWEYIDAEFVSSLELSENQKTKVIHFNRRPPIKEDSTDYVDEWLEIAQKRIDNLLMDVTLEEYEELRSRSNPSVGTQNPIHVPIHRFLNEYNSLLEDIPILGERLYGDVWKVGLVYGTYEDDFLSYSLYPISYDLNDVQIKSVDKSDLEGTDSLGFIRHGGNNPVDSRPAEYARERIDDKLDEVLRERVLDHRVDLFLAEEIVFAFAERYHRVLGFDQRERYSIQEIKHGYFGYLPYWIDEAIQYLDDNDRFYNPYQIDLSSALSQIFEDARDEIDSRVEARIQDGSEMPPSRTITLTDLPIIAVHNCLLYLDQKGVSYAERQYRSPDESIVRQRGRRVWEGFDTEEITANLETFFDHIEDAFDAVVARNFPGVADEISLFDGASKIVVSYDLHEDSTRPPTCRIFYLHSKDEGSDGQAEAHVFRESPFEDWEETMQREPLGVEFRGTRYDVPVIGNTELDFLFSATPMLDYIYDELASQASEAVRGGAEFGL